MIRPFEVVLTWPAARAIAALRRRSRLRVEAWLEHVARFPGVQGDFEDPDRRERVHQVKLIEDCMVTWWVDHAEREVRVVEIEPVLDE